MADKHLQLLRNGVAKDSKAEAISALNSILVNTNRKPGEPALGIYKESGQTYAVLGINISGKTQIIEGVEATQKAIDAALASAKAYTNTEIQKLDVDDAAVEGEYVSAVSEADGKISVSRVALPSAPEVKVEGKAIVSIKEDKGLITATAGDIAAAHVTIADASNHFTATTVEAALDELYSQAGAGSKVTLTSADGTDNVLKVYTIKQGNNLVGTINIPKDLVVESGSVVKGTWDGNTFTEGTGNGTALKLVIANQTAPVYINTLDLVKDHTAGNGIAISDTNVVSVVVDGTSENFLSVGANGLKLSGVANHVASEIAKLDADITASGASGFVTVQVVETDGKVSNVKVTENNIASAALLGAKTDATTADTAFGKIAKEVAERKAAIEALDANVSGSSAHVTVKVDEADGLITAVTVSEKNIASESALNAEISARKKVDGQTGDTYVANDGTNYISDADSLNAADVKLDAAIKANATAITAEENARISGDTALDTRLKEAEKLLGITTGSTTGTSVDDKIANAINKLDADVTSSGNSFVKVQVVETDGKVAHVVVTETNIASASLLGEVGDTSTTTAFGKINANAKAISDEVARAKAAEKDNADAIAKLNGDSATTGSVANSIQTAINALDVNAIGGDGKVITTVSEQDGKIAATAIDLTASAVKATATEATDEKVAITGTTVAAQIESLAKSVKNTAAAAKSYSVVTETTGLPENVATRYRLQETIGSTSNVVGTPIDVLKDSSVTDHYLGTAEDTVDADTGVVNKVATDDPQSLNIVTRLANGKYTITKIDLKKFLTESEFGNGLVVADGKVSVKVDAASEEFLSVGVDGVKLSGVQTAINTAANKAATEVVEDAAGHVTVTKATGANGQAIYTIGENDIASDAALTAEVNRAKAAEDKIEAAVGLAADGSYNQATGNYIKNAASVVKAIEALDTQVKANADAIAQEATARTAADDAIKASIGTSGDAAGADTVYGKIKANAAAIAKLNGDGDGSVAKAIDSLKTTLLGGASESADTLGELEAAINSVKAAAISVVSGNGITVTSEGTVNKIAVKAADESIDVSASGVKVNLKAGSPIVLDGANGLTLGTWDLGNY